MQKMNDVCSANGLKIMSILRYTSKYNFPLRTQTLNWAAVSKTGGETGSD